MGWKETNEKFLNPYQFISLGEKCQKTAYKKEVNDTFTGRISCILKTRGPLFIPNTTNDHALLEHSEHQSYNFFSYDDLSAQKAPVSPSEPVIPGSSLRGMIRSAYEAVTDSCLCTVKDQLLYARTPAVRTPGVLKFEGGHWKLYAAQPYFVKIKRCDYDSNPIYDMKEEKGAYYIKIVKNGKITKAKTGDILNFKLGMPIVKIPKNKKPVCLGEGVILGSGDSKGVLVLGESFARKHHARIFQTGDFLKTLDEADIEAQWQEQLNLYRNEGHNQHLKTAERNNEHNGYCGYDLDKSRANPVWYLDVENHIYLAPANISRDIFKNFFINIIKAQGNHEPCSAISLLCPACKLFGMAGKEEALASRIRFSDATVCEHREPKDYYGEQITLKILGSPSLRCTPFYMEKPPIPVDMWNYDYCTVNAGNQKILIDRPKFRGRKFYWHSTTNPAIQEKDEKKKYTNQNWTVRPIRKDVCFQFDVHFEDLTATELNSLLWVLTIGENKIDGDFCHKLGHGKPIGMGSIKIMVEKTCKRILNASELSIKICEEPFSYNEIQIEQANELIDPDRKQEFLLMSNLNSTLALTDSVIYPKAYPKPSAKNPDASFHWFVGSKQLRGTAMKPVAKPLPQLSENMVDNLLAVLREY